MTNRFYPRLPGELRPTYNTSSCRIHFNRHTFLVLPFRFISEQEIIDTSSGCGENYAVIIVSEQFKGKMTLARHQLGKYRRFLSLESGSSGSLSPKGTFRDRGVAAQSGWVGLIKRLLVIMGFFRSVRLLFHPD